LTQRQASLCGHFELVQLLLDSGALADPDSYERERAVYNALNDKIRNLLLSYDFTKVEDPLQPWSSHINSLLVRDQPPTSDFTMSALAEDFHVHKFLLSARSPYFRRKLAAAPETAAWNLSPDIPFESFRIVLRYLYLGDLARDLLRPGISMTEEDLFRGIEELSNQFELDRLWEAAHSIHDRKLARQRQQEEVQRAQREVEAFFQETVLDQRICVETDKVSEVKWPRHNPFFADVLLRADEEEDDTPASTQPDGNPGRNGGGRSVLFPAHKLFLIRSPYFETMFSSDFLESHDSEHLHIIKVDCTPPVLQLVLRFLYTEKADCPLEHALDVLYTADMLLLDKLKTKAAVAISTLGSGTNNALVDRTRRTPHTEKKKKKKHVPSPSSSESASTSSSSSMPSSSSSPPPLTETSQDEDKDEEPEVEPINVYDVIHAAWDLKVQRLEEFAARYLASRLEDYIDEDEFAELILESASRLKERHETDTIELLDDIRYFLGERFKYRFEGSGINDLLRPGEAAGGEEGSGGGAAPAAAAAAEDGTTGKGEGEVGFRTLDGQIVEDEFKSDAVNYLVLMNKIDRLLEKLKLDA
jgi:ankyrin repeat/BTB/POZ domain-containing protein 1